MNESETRDAPSFDELPIVEIDGEGRILRFGAALARRLGIDPPHAAALTGLPLNDVLPAGRDEIDPSYRVHPANGTGAAVTWLRPILLGDETPGPRRILFEEATDLVRARADCLHLSKLAAAGRLVSSIVHEINNPLSGIIGYSQLVLMRDLDRDLRASLEKIYGEALRTSRIVRNLLDFARKRPTTRSDVHLSRVVRKALELKSHDLRVRNVSVHVDVPDALPPVVGDQHQFLQVFVNLISNAEQAMYAADRGGRITVEAQASGTVVTVLLADTGPGIPPAHRDHLFEPFFTTKEEGSGTGLGLALCRDILRHHGGGVQLVESAGGASFLLTFPVHDAQQAAAATTGSARSRPLARVRNRRLVVVEDDPVFRSMVVEAFEKAGNHVFAFDRSETALRYLRTNPVDAIISDLHRPGLNGMEFHQHVESFDAALAARILFLTGDALNEDLAAFLRRKGNPWLTKPVLLRELHEALVRMIGPGGARQRDLFARRAGGERARDGRAGA